MKAISFVFLILGGMLALFLYSLYHAWALTILWGWFIVPLGVKALSVAHAYGFTVMTGLILGSRGIKTNETKEDWTTAIITWILIPAVALLFGWIAVGFM